MHEPSRINKSQSEETDLGARAEAKSLIIWKYNPKTTLLYEINLRQINYEFMYVKPDKWVLD